MDVREPVGFVLSAIFVLILAPIAAAAPQPTPAPSQSQDATVQQAGVPMPAGYVVPEPCGCQQCGCRPGVCYCQEHPCPRIHQRPLGPCSAVGTCDMPQHHAYDSPMRGYYYFRPYNMVHVAQQQQAVMQWGGDPRNPYSNKVFEQVFEEFEKDQPTADPAEAEVGELPPSEEPAAPMPTEPTIAPPEEEPAELEDAPLPP
jgi:hypothetical protein